MEDPDKFNEMWKKCARDLGSGGVNFILINNFKLLSKVNFYWKINRSFG